MPATEAEMEACRKAGTPGTHHRKLDPFAGTWNARVRHWMHPGADANESTGTMTSTWVLGNRFLKQEYKDDSGQFEGTGFWGYNNVTGRYEGFWIDVMMTGMTYDVGDCDEAGKVWTMSGESEFPTAGRKVAKRTIITLLGPDRHVMEMHYTGPDGDEFKALEIEYARK
jgi:hypothetical protein